jgi:translation initiation factor eIF-2B subunit epsilon
MSERVDPEDVIQAVVIADSFNFRFLPITVEQPRALLPLVNRPLIDYTVEFLAVAGVQEIFVFCSTHAEAIRAHLEASRWMKPTSSVKLRIIVSEDCPSVGDALRDIDAQSLIRSDFILVSGDLVANMQLQEVIQKHRELKKKDKMLVMTCVYKKAKPKHRTRSVEDDILICTSASSGQLLHCEKPRKQSRMNVPLSLLEEHGEIEVRYDVLDCHISICSPNVPQLFSDNFDYQTRHHFIRGILVNEDILGNHIYTHIISDQYAARVCNFHTYDAISRDVIHRWVYPLVPDNTDEACSYGRRNIYLNTNVSLAFGCELHEDVVIGRNSSIGVSTHITQSSIGHNCRIGDHVVIEGAYIWDNCVIEKGSKVYRSILCDSVYVKSGVVIEPGCILSYGVVVGPEFTVKRGSRLTTSQHTDVLGVSKEEWGDDVSMEHSSQVPHGSPTEISNPEEVGREGRGFLWHPPTDEDEESDQFVAENWPGDDESSSAEESSSSSSRSPTPDTQPSHQFVEGADVDNLLFYNEIIDLIRSGLAEQVTTDNTILMINASKHAYNIPILEVPLAIVKAILEGPRRSSSSTATTPSGASAGMTLQFPNTMAYIKEAVTFFSSLLQHYIKGPALQLRVVETLVDCAEKQPAVLSNLARMLLLFYNQDIVEESVLLSWHEHYSSTSVDSSKKQEVLAAVKPVVEWLQTASEESSEGED